MSDKANQFESRAHRQCEQYRIDQGLLIFCECPAGIERARWAKEGQIILPALLEVLEACQQCDQMGVRGHITRMSDGKDSIIWTSQNFMWSFG